MCFFISRSCPPRKAKDAIEDGPTGSRSGLDKTIIIEDSLPLGSDSMDTQAYPFMEEMAQQFVAPEIEIPDEPPSSAIAARF